MQHRKMYYSAKITWCLVKISITIAKILTVPCKNYRRFSGAFFSLLQGRNDDKQASDD
jgi:hypothetical protein